MDNVWLRDHDSIDELANDLMHKLNQRNQYPINTQPFAKSDLHIKDLFRKFVQKVGQLQENLNQISSQNRITQRESERRQRCVDNLNNRLKQIENQINNPDCDRRNALFSYNNYQSISHNQNEAPTIGWNDLDNESANGSNGQSVTQLKETQKLLLKEILEDITHAVEETDDRLTRNTRNIRVVNKKTSTCGYWTVIILLLIAIIVVALVPN
ncbi:hypothetical protein RDWZM_008730 [Blomia tropicalis]|uniref:t-SNARE coiled-coil homology domain-containing protein n=1 Tax=Blomia tropicalis TaxID=40697 RepID=A0A9Q0M2L5_BLOTA|nr:Syntaxin-8 [Blomia tropicalis]KAJ6217573.1 hypothetical protein RDWZM_008730 [Blomia tropicalis]